MVYLLIAALTFGAMFLLDKGFAKLFRNRAQHHSGTAVRLKKGYGTGAVLLCLVAALALMQYVTTKNTLTLVCGIVIAVTGLGLGLYYLRVGIFYDSESFLYTTFTKKTVTYRYGDIVGQKLYAIQGGSYVVELYMTDGKTVSVQSTMTGAYDFLDKAAHARFRQLGVNSAECVWFDPENSCWFPTVED